MSVVGDNLRTYRQAAGMSQEALGKAIGHNSGSYISAIELGHKHPSAEMIALIAQSLGVQAAELRRKRQDMHSQEKLTAR